MRGYRVWFSLLVLVFLTAFVSDAVADKAKPQVIIRASSTITANENGTTQLALGISGGTFLIDISELGVAQTLTLHLELFEEISSAWRGVIISEAFAVEQVALLCVGVPACSSPSFSSTSRWGIKLPYKWRLRYVLNNGTNATFSVSLQPEPE